MMKALHLIALAIPCFATTAMSQGAFQNLNFESANITGYSPGQIIPVNLGMPGWTASQPVQYDGGSAGGQAVSINDVNTLVPHGFAPLQGSFSAILWAGPDVGAAGASSISQTGLVPSSAKSIRMDITFTDGPFTVTLGSQQITMYPLQTFANYTVYGGDVTAEAGLTEALSITEFPPAPPITPPSQLVVDDIQFSSNIVPEPSGWSLMIVGGTIVGALGLWRKQ